MDFIHVVFIYGKAVCDREMRCRAFSAPGKKKFQAPAQCLIQTVKMHLVVWPSKRARARSRVEEHCRI